jgi:LDH2 family malate/lactate/ureidoglycolate dehydrogenase
MLKHFQVPDEIAVRVMPRPLEDTVARMFMKVGVPERDARWGAEVLVYADVRGADTHGVSNALRGYIRLLSSSQLNPRPNWKVVHETASTATVDGDRGLGTIIVGQIMELAIEKARKAGSCGIAVRNSGHCGAVGYYALQAAREGMLGLALTAGGNAVIPTFGAEPKVGTNPIAFAAPAATEPPFVFDAATSSIAAGKIALAKRLGRTLHAGWVAGPDGTPDMKRDVSPEFEQGSMRRHLPLGSTRELGSHKGYGLGVMVEILCGPLSAAEGFAIGAAGRRAHFVQAWDIAGFCDPQVFKRDMDGLLRTLRQTKPAPGHDRVLYAGLPEAEAEADRTKNGIPLHPEVVEWLRSACAELSIDYTLS